MADRGFGSATRPGRPGWRLANQLPPDTIVNASCVEVCQKSFRRPRSPKPMTRFSSILHSFTPPLRALLLFVVKLRLGFRIGIASGRLGNLRHVRLGSLRYGATGMTGRVVALFSPRPPVQSDSGSSAPGDGRTPREVGNGLGLGSNRRRLPWPPTHAEVI